MFLRVVCFLFLFIVSNAYSNSFQGPIFTNGGMMFPPGSFPGAIGQSQIPMFSPPGSFVPSSSFSPGFSPFIVPAPAASGPSFSSFGSFPGGFQSFNMPPSSVVMPPIQPIVPQVRCPRCGGFHAVNPQPQMGQSVFYPPSQIQPPVSFPPMHQGGFPPGRSFASIAPPQVLPSDLSIQPNPNFFPGDPRRLPIGPEAAPPTGSGPPGGESTSPGEYSGFRPQGFEEREGEFDKDILYHSDTKYRDQFGNIQNGTTSCNGSVPAPPKRLAGGVCQWVMLTARHCVQKAASLVHDRLNSGMDYIKNFKINGKVLTPKLIEVFRGSADGAVAVMEGACDAIPDNKIGTLARRALTAGQQMFMRKSQFWLQPEHRFNDPSGRPVPNERVAGSLVSTRINFVEPEGHTLFSRVRGQRLIPGDSGLPTYNSSGQIAGVFSFKINEREEYGFAGHQELLDWFHQRVNQHGFTT